MDITIYEKLYEKSPVLQRSIDKNGIIIHCNQSYAKRLGYTKSQVIGSSIFDHTSKKSLAAMRRSFQTWKKRGRVNNIEIFFKRKDGTTFPGLLSANNIYNKKGKLVGSNTAIREITEIYKSRKKLEKSRELIREHYEKLEKLSNMISNAEKKYRNLYQNSPDLLRSIDLNGIITDCNDAYAKSLGYSRWEVIGKSLFDHTAERSKKEMTDQLKEWQTRNVIINKEIWLKRKDGTTFPVLLSGTNLYDENGNVIGRTVSLRDMTEIYEARKTLEANSLRMQKQYEELEKLSKIKDEFLTMITHELKTPLVPIKGYVDMLSSAQFGPLTEGQMSRLDIIKSNTESMLKLVSDILDAQKLELGQLTLHKEPHFLTEIISAAMDSTKPMVDSNKIKITTDMQDSIQCVCDKTRIEQVLFNLISNSIDFCPKNGEGKLHIDLHLENNNAKIIVKDNGIGIVKAKLDKIFVKFYQIDTSITREHGGTGLGLSVCKGIVENHGGKIWAESEGEDKGTEIHIVLPAASANTQTV